MPIEMPQRLKPGFSSLDRVYFVLTAALRISLVVPLLPLDDFFHLADFLLDFPG
jgi:hypothetical protein